MAASIAATEPLPFVPPTWTSRYRCSGWPSASSSVSIRSSPGRMPACSPPRRARSRATASAYVTGGLARPGRLVDEEGEDAPDGLLELAPLDDHVELPVREQKLGALESLGQRLPDRLGDDPRAREADQRARLGEDDVAEHREARGDPAGGGIREDGNVGQPAGSEPLERGGGLGHLHQGQDTLLHARAARRRDDDHWQVLVDRELDRAGELLAHHRSHAAPEEAELERGQDGGLAADTRETADHGLVGRGLLGGCPDALAVLLGVLEAQRIGRRQTRLALLERAGIGEHRDALPGGDPEGIVALGTDAAGALHLGAVHDLLAGVALDPQSFGDGDFARLASRLVRLTPEPRHDLRLPPGRRGGLARLYPRSECRGGLEAISPSSFNQSGLELGDELSDIFYQRRLPCALLDHPHDRRADDRPVGEAPDGGDLLGRADPEPHAHRLRRQEP